MLHLLYKPAEQLVLLLGGKDTINWHYIYALRQGHNKTRKRITHGDADHSCATPWRLSKNDAHKTLKINDCLSKSFQQFVAKFNYWADLPW